MDPVQTHTVYPSLTGLRLVATDLDGTLLRSDKTLSERTVAVLRRLQAAGVKLLLVSARPPRTVRYFMSRYQIGGLALCCNGAILYDIDEDRIVQQQSMAEEHIEHIVTRLHAELPDLAIASESGSVVIGESAFFFYRSPHESAQPQVVETAGLWQVPSMKLMVRQALDNRKGLSLLPIEELHARIVTALNSSLYSITYSSSLFVEIALAEVQKGTALAAFCAQCGIAAHEVVAFGDMPNDLPLLEWAGLGVAVANAHPLVLQAAGAVTLSNNEDGVAHMLERLMKTLRLD